MQACIDLSEHPEGYREVLRLMLKAAQCPDWPPTSLARSKLLMHAQGQSITFCNPAENLRNVTKANDAFPGALLTDQMYKMLLQSSAKLCLTSRHPSTPPESLLRWLHWTGTVH